MFEKKYKLYDYQLIKIRLFLYQEKSRLQNKYNSYSQLLSKNVNNDNVPKNILLYLQTLVSELSFINDLLSYIDNIMR